MGFCGANRTKIVMLPRFNSVKACRSPAAARPLEQFDGALQPSFSPRENFLTKCTLQRARPNTVKDVNRVTSEDEQGADQVLERVANVALRSEAVKQLYAVTKRSAVPAQGKRKPSRCRRTRRQSMTGEKQPDTKLRSGRSLLGSRPRNALTRSCRLITRTD